MKKLLLQIDTHALSRIILLTFNGLPDKYGKLAESFLKSGNMRTYFRESLISTWIPIPASKNVIFKEFDAVHRFTNIFIETTGNIRTEFQVYVNNHGIIGVRIGENLEDLISESIDPTQFLLEKVPVSKFRIDGADLEYFLDEFSEIEDYLDSEYDSEVYLIDNGTYYSIISFSDKNCIAVNENKSVFLLNKISGQVKFLTKRPQDFVKGFLNREFAWLDNNQG